ncbi:hypothetical protein H0E87_031597, partial [Populus deltoides]
MKDNGSETTTSNQNICPVSDSIGETQDSNADNNLKDCSLDKSRHETVACSQDSKIDDQSSASIKASVVEMEKNAGNESDNEAYVNNSLALVPLSLPASTKKSELKAPEEPGLLQFASSTSAQEKNPVFFFGLRLVENQANLLTV